MQHPDEQMTIRVDTATGLAALAERYDEVVELGRGGMGIVYRARDRHTGDTVAVKVLRAEMLDGEAARRFTDELLLARRITHKNVCRVYEINRFGDVAAISMEYVQGDSLRALLQQVGSVSVRHGVRIVSQILSGLAEAHAQGVIHRDLKPENILIDRTGFVKVMDFGIARRLDARETGAGALTGTPAYMSPEQVAGKTADARSDLYSLGLVMYEMFCGQPAFSAGDPLALMAKQASEVPPRPREVDPDVPARIERVILRLLEKKPERRFPSAEAVLQALTSAEVEAIGPVPRLDSVPASMSTWQRADWLVFLAGVIGLSVYFPLFDATNLTPQSQVTFDRVALERIGRDYRQRLGAPAAQVSDRWFHWYGDALSYVARGAGHQSARAVADNPVTVFSWSLRYTDGSAIEVGPRADLVFFSRRALDTSQPPPPEDAARRQAEQALRDWFNLDATALTLVGSSTFGPRRSFTWEHPGKVHDLAQRFIIGVTPDGIDWVNRWFTVPAGYVAPWRPTLNGWYFPLSVGILALLTVVGISLHRRVALAEPWRLGVAVPVLIMGLLFGQGLEGRLGRALTNGFTFTAGWLAMSAVIERLTVRLDARKLISLRLLFSRSAWTSPCGLSVLRGALVGLALLGLDEALLWVGTRHLGATLDPHQQIWLLWMGLRFGIAAVLVAAVMQTVWIGSFVAVATALSRRLTSRPWVAAVVILTLCGAHYSMASFSEPQFVAALLLVDYLVLVLAFLRYDLLALFTAVFTFCLWWGAVPLLSALQQVGAVGPRLALWTWTLVVLAAAVSAFQVELKSAYRRLATALD